MNDTSKRIHDYAKCYEDLGTMADSVKMEKIIAYRDMRDLAEAEYHRYIEVEDAENAEIFKNYINIFTRKILQLFKGFGTVDRYSFHGVIDALPQSRYEMSIFDTQRSVYGRDANTGEITELLKIDKEVEYDPIQKTCIKKSRSIRSDSAT